MHNPDQREADYHEKACGRPSATSSPARDAVIGSLTKEFL